MHKQVKKRRRYDFCNGQSNSNYKYSDKETEQFLNEIT